jgi:hypothetical protein
MPKDFEKAVLPLRKENNRLKVSVFELTEENKTLTDTITDLQGANAQLKDWVNRLLEYTGMSEEDIKASIEKDKAIADGAKTFNSLMSIMGRF